MLTMDTVSSPSALASSATELALGTLITLVVVHILRTIFGGKKSALPSPPGPKPLPIIGNLLDLPPKGAYEAKWWARHKELYGSISSVTVFGSTFIIVNNKDTAMDLLDGRSLIYSSRPPFTMGKLSGWEGASPLLPHSAEWRVHRREYQHSIGPAAISRFAEIEEDESSRLLVRIFNNPERTLDHFRTTAGAIILKIAYGYIPAPLGHDPLVDLAETAMDIFSKSLAQGTWTVDVFPVLRFLPSWLPGASFKRIAVEWQKDMTRYTDIPFAFVRRQLEKGSARPSFAADLIERGAGDENTMKWLAATAYAGGADTSVSIMSAFLLAMVIYPAAQTRAQEELDKVLGRSTLASLSDKADGRLPYVEALIKEVLRWISSVPMGMPHVCTENNEYAGYSIPEGAAVLANVWQMSHDPEVYHDPFTFKPERFLGPNPEPDPTQLVFGFGRRICPGMDLGSGSVFLEISMILATFKIEPGLDADGRTIEPVCEFSTGIISHPKPFAYSISPRDGQAVALLRSVIDEHPLEKGDVDELKEL